MLLPKFTIRQMLFLMIGIGVVSACLAGASRGSGPAFGLSTAILATIVPFLIYTLIYWIGLGVAKSTSQLSPGYGVSPPPLSPPVLDGANESIQDAPGQPGGQSGE